MPQGRGESRTSPARISAAQRRARAIELRAMGLTFEQVAASPTSPSDPRPLYPGKNGRQRAFDAVDGEMKRAAQASLGKADRLRELELLRLDQLQVAQWPSTRPVRPVRCPNPDCGRVLYREPDPAATGAVLKIMDRRAKLAGLDASDAADERMIDLMQEQVMLARHALVGAMERAGLPAEQQREVLNHVGDILREVDEASE